MRGRERTEEAERWLGFAREDLETAELILGHEGSSRACCFHAQQAVEKAIKASLIFLGIGFRKTHDLEALSVLLPEGWSLRERPAALAELTVWAVEPRYPGDMQPATDEDARATVRQAREAYEATLDDLYAHGYGEKGESTEATES